MPDNPVICKLFVTAGINICHGASAAVPYAASFISASHRGYGKNNTAVLLLLIPWGRLVPGSCINGFGLLLKHIWSNFCW